MASFQVREVIVYIYIYIIIHIYIIYSDSLSHGNFTYTIGDSHGFTNLICWGPAQTQLGPAMCIHR